MALRYKRILLKLSGEALMGSKKSGMDEAILESYARQVKEIQDMGAEVGIVIGGGNIFRGLSGIKKRIQPGDRGLYGHAGHSDKRAGPADLYRPGRRKGTCAYGH